MCEIQFIRRLNGKKLSEKDIRQFCRLMKFGSGKNKDAWGVIGHKQFIKRGGEFNPKIGVKELSYLSKDFLIGHNRLSTCSDCSWWDAVWGNKKKEDNRNHHPFVLGKLALVHNGVIHNAYELKEMFKIKTSIVTDSYVILWLINYYMGISKLKDREKKIIEAIKLTSKHLSGSFSVFVYDFVSKSIYYFKDECTTFHFYQLGDLLIGSTLDTNLNKIYRTNKMSMYIEEGKIYQITNNIKNPIVMVGKQYAMPEIEFEKEKEKEKPKTGMGKLSSLFFDVPIYYQNYQMKGGGG